MDLLRFPLIDRPCVPPSALMTSPPQKPLSFSLSSLPKVPLYPPWKVRSPLLSSPRKTPLFYIKLSFFFYKIKTSSSFFCYISFMYFVSPLFILFFHFCIVALLFLLIQNFFLRRWLSFYITPFYSHSHGPFSSILFSLRSPKDLLDFWNSILKNYWTHKPVKKPGRPPLHQSLKKRILHLKLDNPFWGSRRIRDELAKLGFSVCHETICRIISDYRKAGLIKPNGSWRKFLSAHWNSLFACDFFTVDCFGFFRLYVFFIIQLKSRRIVHWNITAHPTIQFLRLQFSEFEYQFPDSYLIHDNSGELRYFPYDQYRFNHIATSPYSPNMNAYAERFVRSVRQECLKHFIIFSEKQLRNIMREYVYYYNNYRPHQGLHGIPNAQPTAERCEVSGKIKKIPILFGLHHHYYREKA